MKNDITRRKRAYDKFEIETFDDKIDSILDGNDAKAWILLTGLAILCTGGLWLLGNLVLGLN